MDRIESFLREKLVDGTIIDVLGCGEGIWKSVLREGAKVSETKRVI